MEKTELQKIANEIMNLDHFGIQCDDIHRCEIKHQLILKLDKMSNHTAIRLLMHVIHVQQLQLLEADIEYDNNNPFKDMVNFEHIDVYVNQNNSPNQISLY